MLRELHIKNLILIDEMYIEFASGLNVLTGETGAGKTALIEAVNLLLGERGDTSMIRSGKEEAEAQGLFSIDPSRLIGFSELKDHRDKDGDYVIVRKISKEGKSRAYINGNLVNLTTLKELGNILIDLHGQHDHQSLLSPAKHMGFLDRYGGGKLLDLKADYAEKYAALRSDIELLANLTDSSANREREKDLLRFQIAEIETARLEVGEEERLAAEVEVLRSSEKIIEALGTAKDSISSDQDGSTIDRLSRSRLMLSKPASLDERLSLVSERLDNITFELEDLSAELGRLIDNFAFSPERLNEVEGRLAQISLLKKKYGPSINKILAFLARAQGDLALIDDSADRIKRLEGSIQASRADLLALGRMLSEGRKRAANDFEVEVAGHLKDLNMLKIKFKVEIETLVDDSALPYSTGIDKIEFLISPNLGEELRPLAKIASGGEISRIMLALKIALAKVDEIDTLIFDEIDSGVGAVTAGYVGAKMGLLSDTHQIICVTHLPQIAAYGDLHYRVFKEEEGGVTKTHVDKLSVDDRIDEIARMLGGKGSPTVLSKEHAKELLKLAKA